jgi:pyrroline-5-carboxylate reductase
MISRLGSGGYKVDKETKVAFVGPGVMAEAMISGLIHRGVIAAGSIVVSGPNASRVAELSHRHAVRFMTDNAAATADADVIVLAVKPQRLDRVLRDLRGSLKESALVLSIVAGATIEKISSGLDHGAVVRSMPNTPAQIGEGITVWTASELVTEEQRDTAQEVLTAFGDEVFLDEERFLDMATALSGTGPAYVFLFMEAMVDAGVHLGFSRRVAEILVSKTVRGSVDFYSREDDPMHLARLRNQVTSPGGTSAAALYYLEKAGFRTAISRAVWAAYERSRELGVDSSAHWPESLPES